jgi:hypothetical protein
VKIDRKLRDKDTMTSEERFQAAINLQVPDRVPSCPFIYYFGAQYAGINFHELWSEPKKYRAAIDKCWDELGPWDVYYPVNTHYPEVYTFVMPMKSLWPGRQLPSDNIMQLLEEEIMKSSDYAHVIELTRKWPHLAYIAFFMELISRVWDNVDEGWRTYAFILPRVLIQSRGWQKDFASFNKRGATILHGFLSESPFDCFSLARGLIPFVKDCRERPDEVRMAAEGLTNPYYFISRLIALTTGVPRVTIALHRTSNDFVSPKMFDELAFPSLKILVNKMVAAGLCPILHCDGDWDLNLERLRDLPAGRCLVQFDGRTDIFRAKEVLGDRMCIMGDVPPDMLVLAPPSEVDEYCHRLIEEVGKGGGYVMGAGCEIPPNAKPENVKVMLDSVVKYGYYA